jgi:hypothetical protein
VELYKINHLENNIFVYPISMNTVKNNMLFNKPLYNPYSTALKLSGIFVLQTHEMQP